MGNRTTAVFSRSVGVPPTSGTISYGTANSANQYTTVTGLTPISHDSNGNLTQQNGVTYTWDSENRLLSVVPTTPALGDKSLVHTYDGQARRVTRTSREWTATGWTDLEITHFIYDGWNVIEEYHLNTSTTVLVKVLTWGSDLSGSLQGAGGVGGLLMAEEINGTTTTAYHFHYDGNGNVTEITDATATPAASYRYDAFGNTLVSTGSYATQNRYRFSTKPLDSEVTNAPLYYYGYRYYDPTTGRWPSRDPIGIRGGVNLYRYVENNPVCQIDYLGLVDVNPQQVPDPVKAPVIWVDQPKSQNPGLTQNSGLAICICPDIGPKKGTITCEVTSRSVISLNKAATLKAGETWKGVYGNEQRHAKLFASEMRKIIKELEAEPDTPATYAISRELMDKYNKKIEKAIEYASQHDPDPKGNPKDPRPRNGKQYPPLPGSPELEFRVNLNTPGITK
jgi:RHS repeat-associated protein